MAVGPPRDADFRNGRTAAANSDDGIVCCMRLSAMAWALVAGTAIALVVNYLAGVGGECSNDGFSSGCGWIWTISGWVVLACAVGLLGVAVAALVGWLCTVGRRDRTDNARASGARTEPRSGSGRRSAPLDGGCCVKPWRPKGLRRCRDAPELPWL